MRGQTVAPFEKFAFSAKPNEISDLVTTEYGYHIIQVEEKEPARVKPFDEVKDSIAEQLEEAGRERQDAVDGRSGPRRAAQSPGLRGGCRQAVRSRPDYGERRQSGRAGSFLGPARRSARRWLA